MPDLRGGWFVPHAARIDPARLVRGLAAACERHGVTIYERTAATAIERGRVRCAGGTVRAADRCSARPSPTRRSSRPAPALPAALLADDRDRAAARRGLGELGWRDGLLIDDAPLPLLLRPAHDRRAHRDRRPRRPVPPARARSTSATSATSGVRARLRATLARALPGGRGRRR